MASSDWKQIDGVFMFIIRLHGILIIDYFLYGCIQGSVYVDIAMIIDTN